MKIKLDFITNSSSTVHIMIISEDFKLLDSVDPLRGTDNYRDALEYDVMGSEKMMLQEVNKNFQTLKNGDALFFQECHAFYVTRDYIQEKGYMFKDIDVSGGDGMDIIEPISLEIIHRALNRIHENEIEN